MPRGFRLTDATVAAIWRYPVKSMLGEQVEAAAVGERGLAGDRAYALIDVETGNVVSAKNPRRWGRLFDLQAAFLETPDLGREVPPVVVTLPDGSTVRSDDAHADAALSAVLGREVRLVRDAPAKVVIEEYFPPFEGIDPERRETVGSLQIALLSPPGSFFDAAPLHVLTTSTLAALAKAHPGGSFEPRRFRPNLLIDTSAIGDGFVENAWVDAHLHVGTAVALHVVMACPRCVMTTLAQPELPADREILQTVARENRFEIPGLGPRPCAGVYGLVSAGGDVATGDWVALGAR